MKKGQSQAEIQYFFNSMNTSNAGPNFGFVYPCFQDWSGTPLADPYAISTHRGMAGNYVQIVNSPHVRYINKYITNQGMPTPTTRFLNDFSISYSPPTENKPPFPGFYVQADLDAIVPYDVTRTAADDFTKTDLTPRSSQRIAQQLPSQNASVSFAQSSSRPVAVIGPLNTATQQQACKEAGWLKLTEPSGSGEPLLVSPKDDCTLASSMPKQEISKAKYPTSNERRASMARSAAKHAKTDKGKASRARYAKTDKGKASRARYAKSQKGRASNSRCIARYAQTAKGMKIKAICNARSNAYKAAIKKGFSEKLAREKGELAANAKKAELSSLPSLPPPSAPLTEEILTFLMKLSSPRVVSNRS
ncbi:hypothetical protein [Endozoicomonas sp. GU-1]|uniref:hypothetical protein n=1 Tax=Endozoicomonas sp. GU-1 TaxID=3009078 RepID=UPI0022B53864|nr:hypothetical protein [Endozoicomonas sp. GU-1]WBA80503.1 hypothetical protein O2T12_19510 [Endozoicomonas sp. GU-1]WBA88068.1 hypothetical protein O3276_08715 [Endozoicomonas sp. GU-1]